MAVKSTNKKVGTDRTLGKKRKHVSYLYDNVDQIATTLVDVVAQGSFGMNSVLDLYNDIINHTPGEKYDGPSASQLGKENAALGNWSTVAPILYQMFVARTDDDPAAQQFLENVAWVAKGLVGTNEEKREFARNAGKKIRNTKVITRALNAIATPVTGTYGLHDEDTDKTIRVVAQKRANAGTVDAIFDVMMVSDTPQELVDSMNNMIETARRDISLLVEQFDIDSAKVDAKDSIRGFRLQEACASRIHSIVKTAQLATENYALLIKHRGWEDSLGGSMLRYENMARNLFDARLLRLTDEKHHNLYTEYLALAYQAENESLRKQLSTMKDATRKLSRSVETKNEELRDAQKRLDEMLHDMNTVVDSVLLAPKNVLGQRDYSRARMVAEAAKEEYPIEDIVALAVGNEQGK